MASEGNVMYASFGESHSDNDFDGFETVTHFKVFYDK